jgi:hypothetical protein
MDTIVHFSSVYFSSIYVHYHLYLSSVSYFIISYMGIQAVCFAYWSSFGSCIFYWQLCVYPKSQVWNFVRLLDTWAPLKAVNSLSVSWFVVFFLLCLKLSKEWYFITPLQRFVRFICTDQLLKPFTKKCEPVVLFGSLIFLLIFVSIFQNCIQLGIILYEFAHFFYFRRKN